MSFITNIFSRSGIVALAAVAALSFAPIASQASVVDEGDNVYTGTLSPADTIGTPIDLAGGYFTFSGVTGGTDGGLTFSVYNSGTVAESSGAMQILLSSGSGFLVNTLTFDGVALVLSPVLGGFATSFTEVLGQTAATAKEFVFTFSGANKGDGIQITIAPVPLPAGGLLLLSALGGLVVARRRRKAA